MGAGFFLLLLTSPNIPGGDDAYRHVKMASRLIHEPSRVFQDPWNLVYFWPHPVDVWFGYHLLLAPFTLATGLVTAVKLFSSLIFAAIAYLMLLIPRQLDAPLAPVWVLVALTGSAISLHRAALSRPFLLSTCLVLWAGWFTLRQKPIGAAVVSAVHAFSYSIFFLVLLAPAMNLLVRRDKTSLRIALASFGGLLAGLLASPYFPQNVLFDAVQVAVPSIAGAAHVKIGGELGPSNIWWFVGSLPILLLWLAAVVQFLRRTREASKESVMLLAISASALVASVQAA